MTTRKPKTTHFWQGDLPHWQVEEGRYFVTIHLNGSIPREGQERIRQLGEEFKADGSGIASKAPDANELGRRIFLEMEKWLDRMTPVRYLDRSELADVVVGAIQYRSDQRVWEMLAYVVMPNHVHLFFEMDDELSLKCELEEFKRWTGHAVAKVDSSLQGRRFWQSEWFDHWSRSDEEDEKIVRYIQQNPVKAGLVKEPKQWPYVFPKS